MQKDQSDHLTLLRCAGKERLNPGTFVQCTIKDKVANRAMDIAAASLGISKADFLVRIGTMEVKGSGDYERAKQDP
jgi:hypothetical protein